MVVSGLQIKWANADEYLAWVPETWWKFFGLDHQLALGLAEHFTLMWIFVLNGLAYGIYLIFSGEWRELLPKKESFSQAFLVLLHDLGLRKQPIVAEKFNHAQRLAYTGVFILGALAALSGFALYKPIQLPWLRDLFNGYQCARLVHLLVAFGIIGFFVTHIIQVVRAGWNNFQSMVTGDEVETRQEDEQANNS